MVDGKVSKTNKNQRPRFGRPKGLAPSETQITAGGGTDGPAGEVGLSQVEARFGADFPWSMASRRETSGDQVRKPDTVLFRRDPLWKL